MVAKDIAPYAIVGGNPAQVIRYRFDEADHRRLLELRRWDRDAARITRNVKAPCAGDDLRYLRYHASFLKRSWIIRATFARPASEGCTPSSTKSDLS